MKAIFSTMVMAVIGMTGTVNAALFLDDFSSDTSSDYTHIDTFGSGGSFSIDTVEGELRLNAADGNTSTITHNAARLNVGESAVIDVASFTFRDFGIFVSSQAAPPHYAGSGFGNANGFRFFAISHSGGWQGFGGRVAEEGEIYLNIGIQTSSMLAPLHRLHGKNLFRRRSRASEPRTSRLIEPGSGTTAMFRPQESN